VTARRLQLASAALLPIAGFVVLLAGGDVPTACLLLAGGALEVVVWPALRRWSPSKNPDDYR
jgi:heme O synthase-like polyprenyltransferase